MPMAPLITAAPVLALGLMALALPIAVADGSDESPPPCRFTLERKAPDPKTGTEVWVLICHRLVSSGRASAGEVRRVDGEVAPQMAERGE